MATVVKYLRKGSAYAIFYGIVVVLSVCAVAALWVVERIDKTVTR